MDLEMVFNELSARNLAPDISTAQQWMSELISTMREAKSCGLKGIRTKEDFNSMVLAENYPLSRWRNDNEVNRDERTFLRTLATKTPWKYLEKVNRLLTNTLKNEPSFALMVSNVYLSDTLN
jgi:hypothetical protein